MKLRKIVATMLTVATLTLCVQPCFALTVEDLIVDIPQTVDLQLGMEVSARKSGDADYVPNALALEKISSAQQVDYIAELDMKTVRDIFSDYEIAMNFIMGSGDEQLKNDFMNGTVATEITVVIDYPDTAETVTDLKNKGDLVSDNGIYVEKSRTVNEAEKRSVIKYGNKTGIKVKDLIANKDTYFEDLAFELLNSVTYSKAGTHTVSVTLSGSTTIGFASRKQEFRYSGQASHITTVTSEIAKEEHLLAIVPAVPPTCFEDGKTESVICSIHNDYCKDANGIIDPEAIGKLNHKISGIISAKQHIDGVVATCIQEGMESHYTCILCKSDFRDNLDGTDSEPHENFIIPKVSHDDPSWATNINTIGRIEPTCCKPGYEESKYCTKCGLVIKYPVLIPATGNHDEVAITTAVDADCETPGTTAGVMCANEDCGIIIEEAVAIPPKGHDYGDWVITQNATETAEGSKERVCKNNSSHKEVVAIPKLAHTHKIDAKADVVVTPATCTTVGKKQQYCACGEPMGAPVDIPALGHALTPVAELPASCVSSGYVAHYVCGRCGKKFRDAEAKDELSSITIRRNKDAHKELIPIPEVEPTCAVEGLTEGLKCKACNKIIDRQDPIPVVTCKEYADAHLENDKGLHEVDEAPAKCEETGIKAHYHCEICNRDYADSDATIKWTEKDYVIPALGHSYDPAVPKSGTQTPDEHGNIDGTRKCPVCNKTEDVKMRPPTEECPHVIVKKGEDGDDHVTDKRYTVVEKEPTCQEEGKAIKKCHLCGVKTDDNIVIPKVNHDLKLIKAVPSDCHRKGTEAYWKCKMCDQLFDHKDSTVKITAPKETAKITEHSFRDIGHGQKQCIICHDVVNDVKKGEDGNNVSNNGATLMKPAHIKDGEQEEDISKNKQVDSIREDRFNAEDESDYISERKAEASKEIADSIAATAASNGAEVKKVVYELSIEKVTTYYDAPKPEEGQPDNRTIQDINIQDISETMDNAWYRLDIPEDMTDSKDFLVHRLHNGVVDILRTKPNEYGEYIEIAADKTYVDIYVKRFSEYAVVGYDDVVNEPDVPSSTSTSLGSDVYTITMNANGGIDIDDIKVKRGETITLPIPVRAGYVFAGWYTDNEFKNKFDPNTKIERNLTLYAKWIESVLNDADHIAYIMGYPSVDGVEEVRPENNITREEIATIFYRLLKDSVRKELYTTSNNFVDVKADRWSNEYISTMANGGYVNGYEDGTFKPAGAITRAEFVTIAARLYGSEEGVAESDVEFTDVNGHWATKYIDFATASGWIDGYDDGTFKPNKSITRAEVMKIVNNMLNRHVNEEGLVDGVKHWVDNKSDAWYYYDVLEATNAHAYERANGVITETWTSIVK